ncbi:alkaline phosphatase D family protein [Chitinimonas lacunae]|uniref:Alkaline phosphatase D family protein n=1 Tax=Chitinimonas lacunae TaxID=1963018 RepID=A0ABV8MJK5_9NEIS
MSLVLGPILQFRGLRAKRWCISLLCVTELDKTAPVLQMAKALIVKTRTIAKVPFTAPAYKVWRLDIDLPLDAGQVEYEIGGLKRQLSVPAATPRLAYASCNGFSDPKLMKKVDDKNERWKHLQAQHQREPYHLLLLGGDQIYSDEMWRTIDSLYQWTELPYQRRIRSAWSRTMQQQADLFFCEVYLKRWTQAEPQVTLGSIPTVMMWDDHDIFDGWGSYPLELHQSPVFQGLFEMARDYFRIFQLQLGLREKHPAAIPGQTTFNLGFSQLGELALWVLDLRSERSPDRVVSAQSWQAMFDWLDRLPPQQHLLVMSSVPVAYLDLAMLEQLLEALPGQQELEDDLRDHWRSVPHLQERLRLIHRLLDFAIAKRCRVTLLSGDVHVGAACAVESTRHGPVGNAAVINQLISSGVVHPGPPALVRYLLETNASHIEKIDRGITAAMLPIAGRRKYLIGQRNWLAIEPDTQGRLWANWHVEEEDAPITKVIHPVAFEPPVAEVETSSRGKNKENSLQES